MQCHRVTARIDHELQFSVRHTPGASILIVPRIPRVTGKNVSCETKKFTEPVREVKIPTGNPDGLRANFFFVSFRYVFLFSVLFCFMSFYVVCLCLFKGVFCRCLYGKGPRRSIAWVPFDSTLNWEGKISSYLYHSRGITTSHYFASHLPPLNCSCSSQAPSAITVPYANRLWAEKNSASIKRITYEQHLSFPPHPHSDNYQDSLVIGYQERFSFECRKVIGFA